jgi:hypothetical protein
LNQKIYSRNRGRGTPLLDNGRTEEKMTLNSQIALFRRLALALPQAVEGSHMDHPDFRLNNQIFATLSGEKKGYGVLKLTLDQQAAFVTDQPHIFSPVQGGWGRMGMTYIQLDQADESIMAGALKTAYQNLHAKQAQKKSAKRSVKSATPAKTPRRPLQ